MSNRFSTVRFFVLGLLIFGFAIVLTFTDIFSLFAPLKVGDSVTVDRQIAIRAYPDPYSEKIGTLDSQAEGEIVDMATYQPGGPGDSFIFCEIEVTNKPIGWVVCSNLDKK